VGRGLEEDLNNRNDVLWGKWQEGKGRRGYLILVRSPSKSRGHQVGWARHLQEARGYIESNDWSEFPEGTLVYIQVNAGQGGIRGTYVVDGVGGVSRTYYRGKETEAPEEVLDLRGTLSLLRTSRNRKDNMEEVYKALDLREGGS